MLCSADVRKYNYQDTGKTVYTRTKKKQIRRKWLTLARRDPAALSVTTTSYFCEDHFDLANDMENYIEYTTMGVVSQIRMKEGSLPTKFACQPNRARTSDLCRPVAAKRRRLAIIQECEEELDESCSSSTAFEQSTISLPGTSSDLISTHQQQASTIDSRDDLKQHKKIMHQFNAFPLSH